MYFNYRQTRQYIYNPKKHYEDLQNPCLFVQVHGERQGKVGRNGRAWLRVTGRKSGHTDGHGGQ